MTTKFGIGIVFRKAQVSAKYNCPTSTVTLVHVSSFIYFRICKYNEIDLNKNKKNTMIGFTISCQG